jgi:AcrR family transcriptional regulator
MAPASSPVTSTEGDLRQRILGEAIALLASSGIRGATLRDVAGRCGVGLAAISSLFGNKDALIAACFAEVVRDDIDRLDTIIAECAEMQVAADILPSFLWVACEEAGGLRRLQMLALLELLLCAPTSPQFAGLCREWLVARRDALRRAGAAAGVDPLAMDVLGLHLLSESSFAISCAASASYLHLARAGFLEAALLLTGQQCAPDQPAVAALAKRFFADPGGSTPPDEGQAPRGRGAESRARIVDAAASIIEVDGLSAITNRAVADRAGVSLALTTYHFKSVADLSFNGLVRVFEKVNAGFTGTPGEAPQVIDAVERFRIRQPTGVEKLASRGMVEISMAAARGLADPSLGLAIRQQRGTITYAGLDKAARKDVTRMRAASHALWASMGLMVSAAVEDIDGLYDLEAMARIAGRTLLAQS